MKRKPYLYLLLGAAIASALLALFADGGEILLTAVQFPLAPIAAGLRKLSLSGTVGNILAWALYILLCALPLIPFGILRSKSKAVKSDFLLLGLIPVLAVTLYRLINPTGLLAGTEAGLVMYRAQYGGTLYALLICWMILRVTEGFGKLDEPALYHGLGIFLKLLGVLFVISAFGGSLGALLGDMEALGAANQNSGSLTLSRLFLVLQCLTDALPALLNTVTVLMALELTEALAAESDSTADSAQRLAKWCGTTLVITAAASAVFHLLQMLCLPMLRTSDVTLRLPIPSLAFVIVCLIAARIIAENKALRDDNELFI